MSDERIWLGSVVISVLGETPGRMVTLYVPQGAHLPSGIFIATGRGTSTRGEWSSCDTTACAARLAINPQQEAFWKAGRTAEIRYRPSPDAPVIALDMSLMGISAGLAAMDASLEEALAER